ncbi:hypothetical protein ACLKA7_016798 [Drosophila subpalustris]
MWLKCLAWLTLIQLLNAAPNKDLGRIFAGKTVPVKDYPFLVTLRRGRNFICGGALISPSCVLTAAHCLENRVDVQDLFVHAQQQCVEDVSPLPHVRQAWFSLVSPQYGLRGYDSDIAIVKLFQPFDIAGNASTIQVDFNELPESANLTIVGWGQVGQGCNWNQCLQGSNITLMKQQECVQRLGVLGPFTSNMFCALGKNCSDACLGDSGGPVLYGGRTAGIVSWGVGCGSGYPGAYTRLSSLSMTTFVKSSLQKHC